MEKKPNFEIFWEMYSPTILMHVEHSGVKTAIEKLYLRFRTKEIELLNQCQMLEDRVKILEDKFIELD